MNDKFYFLEHCWTCSDLCSFLTFFLFQREVRPARSSSKIGCFPACFFPNIKKKHLRFPSLKCQGDL